MTTPIQALIDASGHKTSDAELILGELNKAGWFLVPVGVAQWIEDRERTERLLKRLAVMQNKRKEDLGLRPIQKDDLQGYHLLPRALRVEKKKGA
jgi:hypothetical protein